MRTLGALVIRVPVRLCERMPRPAAVVRKFLKDMGEADADGKTYCGAEGCEVS